MSFESQYIQQQFTKLKPKFNTNTFEVALYRDSRNKSSVIVTIGDKEGTFTYYDILHILKDMNCVRAGEIDMLRLKENLVYFVNQLILLEQQVTYIN